MEWRDALWRKCIECDAGCDGYGYPCVTVDGVTNRAHRYAYRTYRGEIPPGAVMRHICDNKKCVNPFHLVLGTHSDNVADRVKRNRSARGEGNGRSKLTDIDVIEILTDNETPKMTLAREYGVSPKVVRDIKQGKNMEAYYRIVEGILPAVLNMVPTEEDK